VVGLNLSLVGMNVLISYWSREFFNSIQERDERPSSSCCSGAGRRRAGPMPGFVCIAAVYIGVAVYALYLQQALQIRWRRWLTREYLDGWLADRAYYRIALADAGTDNPDQRIAEDLRMFVDETLTLGLGLMRSVVTLLSFVLVLWSLSGPLTVLGVSVPGYMVWVALLYAALGTGLTHLIGRRLIGLNFARQRAEADFRYALVRLRDNVEGVALHAGEADEKRGLLDRFGALVGNWWEIMVATKRLTLFTQAYGQAAVVFPYLVAAPRYFSGAIPLGGLTQTADAFSQVQGALSWFVDKYRDVAEWRATVQRLNGFRAAVDAARGASAAGAGPQAAPGTPPTSRSKASPWPCRAGGCWWRTRRRGSRRASRARHRPVGSGKSTLFRAVAGIWPFGAGGCACPRGAGAVPAAAALPPARHPAPRPVLPGGRRRVPDEAVRAALRDAGLGHLEPRLDEEDAWDRRCRAASSSAWPWPAPCCSSPTGCSWTRRRRASTRTGKPPSTPCCGAAARRGHGVHRAPPRRGAIPWPRAAAARPAVGGNGGLIAPAKRIVALPV
jgi:putative ATP-binding cassette transporter